MTRQDGKNTDAIYGAPEKRRDDEFLLVDVITDWRVIAKCERLLQTITTAP